MRTLTILSCSLLLSTACKNADEPSNREATAEATVAVTAEPTVKVPFRKDGLFQESAVADPCVLLTAEMVAQVTEKEVKQRKLDGMCLYSWTGGNAALSTVKTYESAAEAKTSFENSHTFMSAAEVKEAMAAVAADKTLAGDGKTVEAPKKTAEAGKSTAGGIRFEAIAGVGDAAAYDTTRHEVVMGETLIVTYPNKLDVLLGNLSFDVSFALNAADHKGLMYKEETITVAKAVLKGLTEAP